MTHRCPGCRIPRAKPDLCPKCTVAAVERVSKATMEAIRWAKRVEEKKGVLRVPWAFYCITRVTLALAKQRRIIAESKLPPATAAYCQAAFEATEVRAEDLEPGEQLVPPQNFEDVLGDYAARASSSHVSREDAQAMSEGAKAAVDRWLAENRRRDDVH